MITTCSGLGSDSFIDIFQLGVAGAEGRHLSEISKDLDFPQLRELAGSARDRDAKIEALEIACHTPHNGYHRLRLNGYRLHISTAASQKVLLAMEEITADKEKAENNMKSRRRPRRKNA